MQLTHSTTTECLLFSLLLACKLSKRKYVKVIAKGKGNLFNQRLITQGVEG